MLIGALALIDLFLAMGSITLFALSAALAIRDVRHNLQGRVLIALLVSLAFLALAMAPGIQLLPPAFRTVATAIGIPNLGLLWWFCLSLLRDDFRIGAPQWLGMAVLAITPFFYLIEDLGIWLPLSSAVHIAGSVVPVVMVCHVIWVALSERSADLVEHRRRARLWIVFAPLAALLMSLLSETFDEAHLASILRNGLGVLPAQLVLLFWLLRMCPEQLQFTPPIKATPGALPIDPKDAALHRRLMQAIEEEKLYLRPGLTIESLAGLLKAPTHQLRTLINVRMGYRNFAAFLNGYRLAHAKEALSDLERARDTVLAIAYESGFASLQSFNRVFKDVVGQTPTDYRMAAFARASQN